MTKKILIGAACIAGLTAGAMTTATTANAAISAGYAYVCSARYETQSTYMGDDGGVRISFYDAPNCTGSYLGYGYLYSAGSPYVTADDQHSEARLLTYFDMAGRAAESGQRVYISTCSGSVGCIEKLNFYGD
ncbi:MAG: hypothetical protein H6712_17760 [Myxococcales bacterium]|nr:hypothetical protein [Myxococcales bacterium]MCB9715721.1 hypothetical protein [Myxococcales bacterium]